MERREGRKGEVGYVRRVEGRETRRDREIFYIIYIIKNNHLSSWLVSVCYNVAGPTQCMQFHNVSQQEGYLLLSQKPSPSTAC